MATIEATAAHHPWTRAQICSTLSLATSRAWVADPQGMPRGHLLTTHVVDEAEILTVAVDPAHQRQGLATALLRAAQDYWQAHGVVTAWLEVRDTNHPARTLYTRHGWVDVGRRVRYYADGTDAVQMRWDSAGRSP